MTVTWRIQALVCILLQLTLFQPGQSCLDYEQICVEKIDSCKQHKKLCIPLIISIYLVSYLFIFYLFIYCSFTFICEVDTREHAELIVNCSMNYATLMVNQLNKDFNELLQVEYVCKNIITQDEVRIQQYIYN